MKVLIFNLNTSSTKVLIDFAETTYYRDKIMDPLPNDNIVKTFEKFGPNFEILLRFTIKSRPPGSQYSWQGIFTMSTENDVQPGTIGRRYPLLLITPGTSAGHFSLGIRFYENDGFGSKKQVPSVGHAKTIEMKLNEPISCIFQYKDGVFNWYLNGQLHWSLDTENAHPYVIENMKLILGPVGPAGPIDGSISYIAVRTDDGVKGLFSFTIKLIELIIRC